MPSRARKRHWSLASVSRPDAKFAVGEAPPALIPPLLVSQEHPGASPHILGVPETLHPDVPRGRTPPVNRRRRRSSLDRHRPSPAALKPSVSSPQHPRSFGLALVEPSTLSEPERRRAAGPAARRERHGRGHRRPRPRPLSAVRFRSDARDQSPDPI